MFNHNTLAKQLIKSLGMDETKTHGLLIAGKPTVIKGDKNIYWGLLKTK
jgi:hypothetical protein